jgi:hypothetical protein
LRKTLANPGSIPSLLISEISQDYKPGMFLPVEPPTSPDAGMNNVFLNALFIAGTGDLDKEGLLLIIEPLLPAAVNAAVKQIEGGFVFMLAGLRSPVTIDMRIRELEKSFQDALVDEYATIVERCFCADDGTVMIGDALDEEEAAEDEDIVERVGDMDIRRGKDAKKLSNPFDLLSDE